MSDKQTNNQALGIAFLMMGVGLSISLGLTLDPAPSPGVLDLWRQVLCHTAVPKGFAGGNDFCR